MDEHDSSTPSEDCWHSTYKNLHVIFKLKACPYWYNLLAGVYEWADCVPVARDLELIVSPPLPSDVQFQFDSSMWGRRFQTALRISLTALRQSLTALRQSLTVTREIEEVRARMARGA